ncbi:macrophage migration inhibitory factor-like [Paramacrobiotus metropolitanus]|uniref:macrophage migration inhibitory factor-like n=1 Tax=Paramacrobiotus metropolitanus TaxID=2943436 RepID=UPI002445D6D6|nr:macrophage migration inhibitory factor-like [Paramacrobiotus metropolitanus]XP_055342700.1 macrophage migration inhibitory factor-like [Paramacrobiotus metropolitanus]
MPTFQLNTNLPKAKIPANFCQELTDLLAKILGKPVKYLCIHVVPDQIMSFAGTTDPCGYAVLVSIGAIGGDKNEGHSKAIFDFIEKKLGIPGDRFYVSYHDQPASEIGHEGKTFAAIFR